MKRFLPALLLLIAIGWNIGLAASALYATHLPIVYGQPVATVCNGAAPILNRDTGSLSAAWKDGHYYVAYQDRQEGGRGHVAEHVGAGLVDVPLTAPIVSAPAFSPPDSVKVGSVALVVNGPTRRLYYTSRVIDADPTIGPYAIWCVEF